MEGKPRSESMVITRYPLLPRDTNPRGKAFGGSILEWIDSTAAMAAHRHAGCDVVTAALDSIIFLCPISMGEHIVLEAFVTYTGRSSMEVKVDVYREDPVKGTRFIATTAYVAMIALSPEGVPMPVPSLLTANDEERAEFEAGRARMEERKKLRARYEDLKTCH